MRILIVGAGATGGYFGARMAAAGRDVTFLVRAQRAAHLRAHGLQVVSPHGNFSIAPQLIAANEIKAPFDFILLTVKAFALDAAIADLAPAVGPETMVMPVLNGMRHMDVLTAKFGAKAVIGGLCKIAGTIDAEGRIVQMTPLHEIAYGERDGSTTPRITALDKAMTSCGFDARLTGTIEREMWEKWVVLATMGGINCLMRGTIGEIAMASGGMDLMHAFLDEVVTVVKTVGQAPSPELVALAGKMLSPKAPMQSSSMYRDLQQGLPIEADQIIGDLLARAQAAKMATPLLAATYAQLSVYQNRLKKA
ncbi:MAG TPA: ketopantoate reductase family protein [Magnetospirillaceae bacterium]|jgi:2-dehydropantoate 2-reductase